MLSFYAAITPHFTQNLPDSGLRIGYTDNGRLWALLAPNLSARLPLRGIEWKNTLGVRQNIDQLQLKFEAFPPFPINDSTLPFVCLYIVKCEDLEQYKSRVKPQLTKWIQHMFSLHAEYLIVYVQLGAQTKSGAGQKMLMIAYRKIYDRLRADFGIKSVNNSSGNQKLSDSRLVGEFTGSGNTLVSMIDRICKLEIVEGISAISSSSKHPQHDSQWDEFMSRLKSCIMQSFEARCLRDEDALRSLEAKRDQSDRNMGTFLLAKERVALLYQQVYLLDDALRHFDELEAIRANIEIDVAKGAALSCNESTVATFQISPLALQDRECISHCDAPAQLRLHIFCCQIRILFMKNDFIQLLERSKSFIPFFRNLLDTAAGKVEWYNSYQWVIGACCEIAVACDVSWAAQVHEESSLSMYTELLGRYIGDIFYLARRVLMEAMRLQVQMPSSHEKQRMRCETPLQQSGKECEWYLRIRRMLAVGDVEAQNKCLWEITHLSSLFYSRAGLHRFAVFLGKQCAEYHLQKAEFESASRLFRSYIRQCEEDRWWELNIDARRKLLQCELELDNFSEACLVWTSTFDHARKSSTASSIFPELVLRILSNASDKARRMLENVFAHFIDTDMVFAVLEENESSGRQRTVEVTLVIQNNLACDLSMRNLIIAFEIKSERDQQLHGPLPPKLVVFEAENVHLRENAMETLKLRQNQVQVGVYQCTAADYRLECTDVMFPLMKNSELLTSTFKVQVPQQYLELTIQGSPFLMPSSIGHASISFQSLSAAIQNISLRLSLDQSGEIVACGVEIQAIRVIRNGRICLEGDSVWSLSDKRYSTKSSVDLQLYHIDMDALVCVIIDIWVPQSGMYPSFVTLTAQCDFEHMMGGNSHVENCCQRAQFPISQILNQTFQTKLLGMGTFVSLSLVNHADFDIIIDDFELIFSTDSGRRMESRADCTKNTDLLQDINEHLRGTCLQPLETLKLAYLIATIQRSAADEHAPTFHVSVRIANLAGFWKANMVYRLLPDSYTAKAMYRIDVRPTSMKPYSDAIIVSANQPIVFSLQINQTFDFEQAKSSCTLLLSLCGKSGKDWIILGKAKERIILAASNDPIFVVKKLQSLSIGRIPFPRFCLCTLEGSAISDQVIDHVSYGNMIICIPKR